MGCKTSKTHEVLKPFSIAMNSELIVAEGMDQNASPNSRIITSFQNIRDIYMFGKYLGSGGYGSVKLCWPKKDPNRKFAVKSIFKDRIAHKMYVITREIEILKTLDHPNIVKLYETYQDKLHFHIVMEYCGGGELISRITKQKQFNEIDTAVIMKKLISAVNYMHINNIVHRDLKPENVLFESDDPEADLKLVDFGLSTKVMESEEYYLQSKVGTPLYVAPEVLKGKYNEKCDLWSLGVIMYILLSGSPPFIADTAKEILEQIKIGNVKYEEDVWPDVSKEAKDLLRKMLCYDQEKRIDASMALKHKWFNILISKEKKKKAAKNANLSVEKKRESLDFVIAKLRKHEEVSKFKREALNLMMNRMSENEISELKEIFQSIDVNGTGMISIDEVLKAAKNLGQKTNEVELKAGFESVKKDYNPDFDRRKSSTASLNYINYSEFIAMMIDSKRYMSRDKLKDLFDYFDQEGNQEITTENIKEMMLKKGKKIDKKVADDMIKEIDVNHDGRVTFADFYKIMYGREMSFEFITPSRSELNTEENEGD